MSHSRRGKPRWRRPRAQESWKRTLRCSQHALDSTFNRIEASARVIDAAERFAPARPLAATRQLLLVSLWLIEAATHLGRAARGLNETDAWLVAGGAAPADVPWRIIVTAADWAEAARQLAGVSNRLYATSTRLREDIIAGVLTLDPPAWSDAEQVLSAPVRTGSRSRITLLNIASPVCPRAVAGARRVSRGRAPPSLLDLHSLIHHAISRKRKEANNG